MDRLRPYFLAVLCVAVSTAARLAVDPILHNRNPFLLYACGVVIAALYGRVQAGIAATILSVPICAYLFLEPRDSFFLKDTSAELMMLTLFLVLGVGISIIVERLHRSRQRLRQSAEALKESELKLRTLAATVPDVLFTIAPDGRCGYASRSYCDYVGLDDDRARAGWIEAIHPEDRPVYMENWSNAVQAGTEFEATYRVRRADGEYRWFQAHAKPIRPAEGQIANWSGVSADIHEHKLLEQTLARRTKEVAAASEEFQNFAYRVGHDLKEPLRMIAMYSEMLVRRNEDRIDEESRMFTRTLLEGVDRVEQQLRNLLEYARAGSFEMKNERIDFNAAADAAIANLQAAILETRATVTHDRLPSLEANAERIRSVFQNLVGNALKYRGSCPPVVHISARQERSEWIFAVKDNGAGFDPKDAERIFQPFERARPASRVPGSGLGLAIVKRVIELKGGRIWAESEPGRGSTFYFSLPRSLERKSSGREEASAAVHSAGSPAS
jgi:PAS domain S-box-containing protein